MHGFPPIEQNSRREVSFTVSREIRPKARPWRPFATFIGTPAEQLCYQGIVSTTGASHARNRHPGRIYTSGGITAGIDRALALIERDHSRRLALKVAKRLLVFLKRPGDQLQFNTFLAAQVQPTRFEALLDWITDNLDKNLDTASLAERAFMSERSFRRHFEAELSMPVRRYLAQARVLKAQSLLETTSLPIAAVAARCGFKSPDAMRYAFVSELEVTPSEYRQRFGDRSIPRGA